jgi:hypothetical protein
MSPHDVTTDATTCYPLTGRHAQVAAILGHEAHGGRVRLTVTQARQIGELVAREQWLLIALYAALTASQGVSGVSGPCKVNVGATARSEGAGGTRGCVMGEPTEADREKARELLTVSPPRTDINPYWRLDMITQALADERERARAPFLALADDLDLGHPEVRANRAMRDAAESIRRAAEETGQ